MSQFIEKLRKAFFHYLFYFKFGILSSPSRLDVTQYNKGQPYHPLDAFESLRCVNQIFFLALLTVVGLRGRGGYRPKNEVLARDNSNAKGDSKLSMPAYKTCLSISYRVAVRSPLTINHHFGQCSSKRKVHAHRSITKIGWSSGSFLLRSYSTSGRMFNKRRCLFINTSMHVYDTLPKAR